MTGQIDARLAELGITLPDAPAPAAKYVPAVRTGNLVFVSGQISMDENGMIIGKLGDGFSTEDGAAAARVCAINLMAQMRAACDGDLDRVAQVVKLTGFVNSTADYPDHPKVINGASELFADVFGDKGKHARSAFGVVNLPFGVAVEIEAIFEIG
ncbi:MAG: RidA family protein [Pseudomonadota bacterium]